MGYSAAGLPRSLSPPEMGLQRSVMESPEGSRRGQGGLDVGFSSTEEWPLAEVSGRCRFALDEPDFPILARHC